MLVWLSGNENTKRHPNENYARELMELFTLGADAGYTEDDVREQARALTGWTNDWDDDIGSHNFHFDAERYDSGSKRIFGRSGTFDWKDSCRLCLQHPAHDDYFVRKLWSYFIPKPPPKKTLAALKKRYRKGYAIRPVVESILLHPALYEGPRMIKPPIVQIAGLLRGRKTRDLDRQLDLARRRRRPAPLRPAERRRLGRGALARHGSALGPLERRGPDHRCLRGRGRRLPRRGDGEAGGREGARLLGHARRCRRRPRRSSCGSPARSRRSSRTSRSGSPTGRCARTRCGC